MIVALYILLGAILGFVVANLSYVVVGGVKIVSSIFRGNTSPLFSDLFDGTYGSVVIFWIVCGAILGLLYGLFKLKVKHDQQEFYNQQKLDETEDGQEKELALAIKNELSRVAFNRVSVASQHNNALIDAKYSAGNVMGDILKQFDGIVEHQGYVEALADNFEEEEE